MEKEPFFSANQKRNCRPHQLVERMLPAISLKRKSKKVINKINVFSDFMQND